jgi:PAS domain S-box-containing protein
MTNNTMVDNPISERRFQLLIASVTDYAIYMLDPDGYVNSWNPGAQRFKGYIADEIIGQHFSVFYTEEERMAGIPAGALRTAREGRHPLLGLRRDRSRA